MISCWLWNCLNRCKELQHSFFFWPERNLSSASSCCPLVMMFQTRRRLNDVRALLEQGQVENCSRTNTSHDIASERSENECFEPGVMFPSEPINITTSAESDFTLKTKHMLFSFYSNVKVCESVWEKQTVESKPMRRSSDRRQTSPETPQTAEWIVVKKHLVWRSASESILTTQSHIWSFSRLLMLSVLDTQGWSQGPSRWRYG